jgi:hypothetical protein
MDNKSHKIETLTEIETLTANFPKNTTQSALSLDISTFYRISLSLSYNSKNIILNFEKGRNSRLLRH